MAGKSGQPEKNSHDYVWGIMLNDSLKERLAAHNFIIEENSGNLPKVKANTFFNIFFTDEKIIETVDDAGNPVDTENDAYAAGDTITYISYKSVFENSDRTFTWGSGNFPAVTNNEYYCLYCDDTSGTDILEGVYGAKIIYDPPPPDLEENVLWDDELQGWYIQKIIGSVITFQRVLCTFHTDGSGQVYDIRVMNSNGNVGSIDNAGALYRDQYIKTNDTYNNIPALAKKIQIKDIYNKWYPHNYSNSYISLIANGNEPPTILSGTHFSFVDENLETSWIKETSNRTFTWAGLGVAQSDGTWYIYCYENENDSNLIFDTGNYTVDKTAPGFDITRQGWYWNNSGNYYKCIGTFLSSSGVVSNIAQYQSGFELNTLGFIKLKDKNYEISVQNGNFVLYNNNTIGWKNSTGIDRGILRFDALNRFTIKSQDGGGIEIEDDTGVALHRFFNNGTVSINSSAASGTLDINGTLFAVLSGSTGGSDCRYNTGTNEIFYDTSTSRDKENIREFDISKSEKIYDLKIKTYDRKDGSKINEDGLIAEDVIEVFPDICFDICTNRKDIENATKELELQNSLKEKDELTVDELTLLDKKITIPDPVFQIGGYNKNDLIIYLLSEIQKLRKEINELKGL